MLFGYPVSATENNWLHESLRYAIVTIHGAIEAGNDFPGAKNVIPTERWPTLKLKRGLREKLLAYDAAVRNLSTAERAGLIASFDSSNQIASLVSNLSDCPTVTLLPEASRAPIIALFDYAFGLLRDLGIRDTHYKAIYDSSADHICPFCGIEHFDAPGGRREPLDHYLAKSTYPFSAANLRNLAPMGEKCNSGYKLSQDILRRADGTRRKSFDPYNHASLSLSLDRSTPFDGVEPNVPNWEIDFLPDSEEVATWDEVLSIRERYKRDNLNPDYQKMLKGFAAYTRKKEAHRMNDAELSGEIAYYGEFWADQGLSDRAFLKAAVFRMLSNHCRNGDARLLAQFRDLVKPPPRFPPTVLGSTKNLAA